MKVATNRNFPEFPTVEFPPYCTWHSDTQIIVHIVSPQTLAYAEITSQNEKTNRGSVFRKCPVYLLHIFITHIFLLTVHIPCSPSYIIYHVLYFIPPAIFSTFFSEARWKLGCILGSYRNPNPCTGQDAFERQRQWRTDRQTYTMAGVQESVVCKNKTLENGWTSRGDFLSLYQNTECNTIYLSSSLTTDI